MNYCETVVRSGEIMRSVLFSMRRGLRRDHGDDDGGAHEPLADPARVHLQRPSQDLHLFHRILLLELILLGLIQPLHGAATRFRPRSRYSAQQS